MLEDVLSAIDQYKIIAIVRGIESSKCMEVAEALYQGGIRLIEITYNQREPNSWEVTAEAIRNVAQAFQGRMFAGAGTVTNTKLVALTAKAGGKYIISPNTNVEVIKATKQAGMISIPGAMTPSEILTAHEAEADLVKLFPASDLGIGYLKAIRAPINHVKLLATGGINENNAKAVLDAGAAGLGVGGSLANKKVIEERDYNKLTEAARRLISSIS